MIRIRRTYYFGYASKGLIFLILFFLFRMDLLPDTGKNLELQLQRAKVDYVRAKYEEAKVRLERLAAVYENVKIQSNEMRGKYGQVFLMLGACYEKNGSLIKAKEYYEKGLWESPECSFIFQTEMKFLPIYKKVLKRLNKRLEKSGVIIKSGKRKKKRIYMLAGSAVAAVFLLYLLLKK